MHCVMSNLALAMQWKVKQTLSDLVVTSHV